MSDQNENGSRRRFFQILQQCVGGVGVHVVGRIDDDHTITAVMRSHRKEAIDPPDLLDGNDRLEALGLFICRAGQMQHRGVRADGDLAKQGRCRIRRREFGRRVAICREFQQMISQVESKRSLADAGRAGKQQCVRQLAGAIGRSQHRSCLPVADQARVLRRLGNAVQRVMLLGCDPFEHHASCVRSREAWERASSAAKTVAVTTFSTASASAEASMTTQRSGSFSAMARNAFLRR